MYWALSLILKWAVFLVPTLNGEKTFLIILHILGSHLLLIIKPHENILVWDSSNSSNDDLQISLVVYI